jgi:D-alanyl-D-alanine carboxypeptidase
MNSSRRLLFLFALALAATVHGDAVDDMVREEMVRTKSPAIAIAVVKNGKIVRSQAYGLANVEHNVPATIDTVFRVASMSKQFCAASVLLLAEEGKVSLDDSITRFLPDAPDSWKPITFRHVLSHTAGIPDANPSDGFTFRTEMSPEAYLSLLYAKPLKWAPGSRYEYSNPGYSMLGIVVGRIAGMPMEQFVAERIWKPVGMEQTYYYTDDGVVPNRASGYVRKGPGVANALHLRPYVMHGSGGILSTVTDFAKWDAALRSDAPLSRAIREVMWARQTPEEGASYGYGFFVDDGDKKVVRHSGGTMGFTSNWVRHLDEGLTVIVLQNVGAGGAVALSNRIAEHYLKEGLGPPGTVATALSFEPMSSR